MLEPKAGCYAIFEATEEGWENAEEQMRQICEDLQAAGIKVVKAPEIVKDEESCQRVACYFSNHEIHILIPLIITWSFDHFNYMIWQKKKVPIAIRTIPGIRTGSVVGGQQLGAVLKDLGIEHKLFYGPIGDRETAVEIAVYAKAAALKASLEGAKFLMLGRRTPGMTPIAFDEVEIMRKFGAIVSTIGMDEFEKFAANIDNASIEEEWKKILLKAAYVNSSDESGLLAVRNYLAMQKIARQFNYKGIAIGSYPECQGKACLAISLLNDEGIAAGCEGDMNSTIAMYLLGQLSCGPVHFGEMLEMNYKDNTIISSHCGAAAISLACREGFVLCPVRLANSGVCVRFKSKTGPVTYVNLVGRKNTYRMCAFEGTAVETEMVFEGNPMKIEVNSPLKEVWKYIADCGFSHHWMAVYSHVVPVLKEFCKLTGIMGVFPDIGIIINCK